MRFFVERDRLRKIVDRSARSVAVPIRRVRQNDHFKLAVIGQRKKLFFGNAAVDLAAVAVGIDANIAFAVEIILMVLHQKLPRRRMLAHDIRRHADAALRCKQIVMPRQASGVFFAGRHLRGRLPIESAHILVAFVRRVPYADVVHDAAARRKVCALHAFASAAPHLIVVVESVIRVHGIIIGFALRADGIARSVVFRRFVGDFHVVVAGDDGRFHSAERKHSAVIRVLKRLFLRKFRVNVRCG